MSENSPVYLSINNIFDRNPGDLQNLTGLYDIIIGRNYTLGMRHRF